MQHPFSVTQSSLLHVLKRSFNDELHVPVADGESHTNSNQVRHNKRSRQDRGISFRSNDEELFIFWKMIRNNFLPPINFSHWEMKLYKLTRNWWRVLCIIITEIYAVTSILLDFQMKGSLILLPKRSLFGNLKCLTKNKDFMGAFYLIESIN
jgi:hypothetical protein